MTDFERENPDVEVIPPGGKKMEKPEFPWKKVAIMALIALLYTGSPIDFIPDFIPLLGLLDDVLVNAGVLGMIARALLKYYSLKSTVGSDGFLKRAVGREDFKKAVPSGGKS